MVQEASYDFFLSQMEPPSPKEKEMDFKIQRTFIASSCEEMASTMTGAKSSVLKGLQQCIDIVIAKVDR
ncbi:hypothetical protein L1887_31703 [Cichorium endivia]|nr:hypothetical protein L1887_31703 [Cichorium endivia]